eukprot:Clim_evm13s22 gene=Clim_evmTU13s22
MAPVAPVEAQAQKYLEKHNINALLESLVVGLLYHKPDEPIGFLQECLGKVKDGEVTVSPHAFAGSSGSGAAAAPSTPAATSAVDNFKLEPSDDLRDQRVIFVIGGPGAGKGTQAEKIVEEYGLSHLSAGDLLRAEVAKGTELGTMIDGIVKEGKLVDQEVTITLLRNAMRERKSPSNPGFIIDGFPRDTSQGIAFESNVVKSELLLFFECGEETMEKRLLKRGETSGRSDDNIEAIKKRFKTFMEQSLPVVDHYGDKVVKINAERGVDEIFADVKDVLDPIFGKAKDVAASATTAAAPVAPMDASEAKQISPDTKVIFVLGGPGAGKGTQCDRIVADYGFGHISTGDLLRAEVASGSTLGREVEGIMAEGKLVSNDIVLHLVRQKMVQNPDVNTWLLDGYPREVGQAVEFEEKVLPAQLALFFECGEAVMEERLLKRGEDSGRADDNKETITKRFATFMEKNKPVCDHMGDLGKLVTINAESADDEVYAEVRETLKRHGMEPKS